MKKTFALVLAFVLALCLTCSALAEYGEGMVKLVGEPDTFSEDAAMFAGADEKLVYPAEWTEGLHGQGLSFAGLKTHVRFDGALVTSATALTLSTWIYWRGPGLADATALNATGDGVLIFGLSGSQGHLKVVAMDGEKGSVMTFAGGLYNQDVYAIADAALPVDAWSMVTATIDGQSMSLYLNGQVIATAAQTVTPDQLKLDLFRIGSSFWGPPSLNAVVDDAAVWQRALSAQEIAALYDAAKVN